MAEEKVRQVGPRNRRGMPHAKIEHPGRILARTLRYVWQNYSFLLILAMVCIVVSVLANVQGTLFTKTLIDTYITPLRQAAENGTTVDYSQLGNAITKVAVFYLLGIAAAYGQQVIMTYVTQGTMKRLRTDVFTHMESLPLKYFDTHSRGDIMSVFTNDIDTLRQMIGMSMPAMLQAGITIVSVFISMLILSWQLTLLTIVMIVVMLFISGKSTRISGSGFIAQQRSLGKINGFIEETMSGQKVVKVFNHEKEVLDTFGKLNQELYEDSFKANGFSNAVGPISVNIGNISYVLCAIFGGLIALNKTAGFTVGALASFLTFNRSFSMPINQITMQINAIMMALAGADRIFHLLDEKSETDNGYVMLVDSEKNAEGEIQEADHHTGFWAWKHYHKADNTTTYVPLEGDVTFNHVDFGYTDEKMVLHDIVIHAEPGQKVALVGSTGAGKTTITNLINRFYDIQDGKIRFDNININKIRKQDLRRSLGMVLQETNLFTGTVRDNIRFGKLDASDEEIYAAAKLANADNFIRHLPQGYDTVLTGNGASLSQGQRQLLAIARAAIADPPVLILDEATSSIDTRTEKLVQDGMDQLMKGRTTFVIAHRLSTIRNADLILVLENGRIVERGNHEELLALKGRYYQLYTGKRPELAA